MKEKLNKFFKSKIPFLIIGLFIGGITSAYAITYFPSKQVTYDNSSSKLKATQVQAAIDELYSTCKECTSIGGSNSNIYVLGYDGDVYKWNGNNFSSFGRPTDAGQYVGIATG